ncbi:MAG: protein-L-isoaspartate O-methyltransferase [Alphaproteobacteria bacterium]|nr:protein-L-isoaspartate O-methyltransferase [Alphaproteobacteria bacterium]
MPDYFAQRLNMVESQVRTNDVTDRRIQDAMKVVPRERFVPSGKRALAYADAAVEVTPGRFLLDPRTLSKLAQVAQIKPSDRILDVGCATGYSTAVLARLAGEVIGLEEDHALVEIARATLGETQGNVQVVQGSLTEGWQANAPYDVIFLNGSIEFVPVSLRSQLGEDGRLVAVVRKGPQGRACRFLRERGRMGQWISFDSTLPFLHGFREPRRFVF